MATVILKSGETVHDFRQPKLGWGWNGLTWNPSDDKKTAEMTGIGKGLEVGHFIAVNHGEDEIGYKIEAIQYDTNPTDLFKALVSGHYSFDEGDLD